MPSDANQPGETTIYYLWVCFECIKLQNYLKTSIELWFQRLTGDQHFFEHLQSFAVSTRLFRQNIKLVLQIYQVKKKYSLWLSTRTHFAYDNYIYIYDNYIYFTK